MRPVSLFVVLPCEPHFSDQERCTCRHLSTFLQVRLSPCSFSLRCVLLSLFSPSICLRHVVSHFAARSFSVLCLGRRRSHLDSSFSSLDTIGFFISQCVFCAISCRTSQGALSLLKLGFTWCAPYAIGSPCNGGKMLPGRQDRLEVLLVSSFPLGSDSFSSCVPLFCQAAYAPHVLDRRLNLSVQWLGAVSACYGASLATTQALLQRARQHERPHVRWSVGCLLLELCSCRWSTLLR